jgi:hypothetical protein
VASASLRVAWLCPNSEEFTLSRESWIRQNHRRLSVVFVVAVLVNIVLNVVASGQEDLTVTVGLLTLIPLVLLMATGLYLFALPYTARGRAQQSSE